MILGVFGEHFPKGSCPDDIIITKWIDGEAGKSHCLVTLQYHIIYAFLHSGGKHRK